MRFAAPCGPGSGRRVQITHGVEFVDSQALRGGCRPEKAAHARVGVLLGCPPRSSRGHPRTRSPWPALFQADSPEVVPGVPGQAVVRPPFSGSGPREAHTVRSRLSRTGRRAPWACGAACSFRRWRPWPRPVPEAVHFLGGGGRPSGPGPQPCRQGQACAGRRIAECFMASSLVFAGFRVYMTLRWQRWPRMRASCGGPCWPGAGTAGAGAGSRVA